MDLLVLGGTVFLSRAVAEDAVARGHRVVCAARGRSGSVPAGASLVVWDRADPLPRSLVEQQFDAVVDVGRHPTRVRAAVAALPDPHWVFVSTVSVYADDATHELHRPIEEDVDLSVDMEAYGPMKVACEQAVTERASSATIVRPGLIAGPGDTSGRFSYWPARVADGGEVLTPGSPDDIVQVIDARDLAHWIVDCAEARTTGTFDAVGSGGASRRGSRRRPLRGRRQRHHAHLGAG